MAFANEILAGTALVRNAIKSENYLPGVAGWSINRDGTAELGQALIRGSLRVGAPPSPPSPYIEASVLSGIPTIAIYDGTHVLPARIMGWDLGGEGGLVLDTGNAAIETAGLSLGGSVGELIYQQLSGAGNTCLVHVGPPYTEGVKIVHSAAGMQTLELATNGVALTPDGVAGRWELSGEMLMGASAPDAGYSARMVDGKVAAGTVTTAVAVATDVVIASANAINVYAESGWAYRATVAVDHRTAVAGQRLDYKLWDGNPGVGTQLGGTVRRFLQNTGVNFDNTLMTFLWRQGSTSTMAAVNLSAARAVGAGSCDVAVNAAYLMIIEKIGDANRISNL